MNYELAKQLKESGFPQEKKLGGKVFFQNGKESQIVCEGAGYECDCTTTFSDGYGMSGAEETVYVPSLSELIEACGDKFYELKRYKGSKEMNLGVYFLCYGNKILYFDRHTIQEFKGDTAEEAVAKLYINIKK